jgi:hypothetical protein
LLASFAKGIAADKRAVAAAISEQWSNGQIEGQFTKLKMLKHQMYGRSNLDLLRARLCSPYPTNICTESAQEPRLEADSPKTGAAWVATGRL